MKRQLATDIVAQALLWYGGEQVPRKQIYEELLAEGHEKRYVDFYVFSLANHQPEKQKECEQ